MKIAVNTRLLLKNKLEGIGWFTFQNLKRIVRSHPEHDFFFIFDRKYDKEFIFSDNITPMVVHPPARHPVLWIFWFEWSVRRVLKKLKPDIFVSFDGHLSILSDIPSLAIIHDINFNHRPFDLPFFNRVYYRYFFPRFARKSALLGTVSEYSRNDISKTYQINAEKIFVINNGAHEVYKPVPELIKTSIRNKYSRGFPFFVFVGALHPRKNIINLLKAFDMFREDGPVFKLIIVGNEMFYARKMRCELSKMKHKEDVIFTGRLEPEDLHLVMGSAEALCFLPFFEGFGIPIIEAMQCEIPILASNRTSVPEVAGEAALYADPDDINDMASGMHRIVNDKTLRKTLIDAGKERRLLYTWDSSSEKLWTLINDVVKLSRNA